MAWHWRTDASEPAGPDQAFASQAAAEAWLTGNYEELAEQGVRAVSLYEEDRLVYGPMSLDAD